MLYTEQEREEVAREFKKRRLHTVLPAALLLLLSVVSFVWFRAHRDTAHWWLTALLTVLGGGWWIFFYGVYLRPVSAYLKHIDRMRSGRMRVAQGVLSAVDETVSDKDGLRCVTLTVNVGEKADANDDRTFYVDELKRDRIPAIGTLVSVSSNDRMVSAIETVQKES